jgi:hypothetical protein
MRLSLQPCEYRMHHSESLCGLWITLSKVPECLEMPFTRTASIHTSRILMRPRATSITGYFRERDI